MNRQEQGDLGELSAMAYNAGLGCSVYVPVGHSPDVDFIADDGERLVRAQVRTSGYLDKGRWCVVVCTRGGNQSWNGIVKRFSAARCDELFAVTVALAIVPCPGGIAKWPNAPGCKPGLSEFPGSNPGPAIRPAKPC